MEVALPLDDPNTPPPGAGGLSAYCLAIAGGQKLNVSQALANGGLQLSGDGRFLVYLWQAGAEDWSRSDTPPSWLGGAPLRGLAATASLGLTLYAAGPCGL